MRFLWLLLLPFALFARQTVEFDYELDAYYSNVSAFIDIDRDKNITDATRFTEVQIYSRLLRRSFSPNIFLIEASFHPMSWGGVWYRKHYPQKYQKSTIEEFNIVKALTAGWEEPYSLSFFFGTMMVFKRKNASHIGKNRAFIGTLFSIGNKSIKDNMDYPDRWGNVEFKLKGTRELENKDLDWSFRIGYRFHSNKDFANTFYLGARRSSIDFYKPLWSLRYNSAFETMLEWNASDWSVTKAEVILEKKFPSKFFTHITYGLGIGYLYYGGGRYRGALKEEGIDNHQLLIRPNIKW